MRVGGILTIPEILRDFGVDPDGVLLAAGINPILLDDADNLITYASRGRLISRCADVTGCPHIGLLIGQQMDLPALGIPGMLARSMPNVRTALRTLEKSFQSHTTGAELTLRTDGDLVTLTYEIVIPDIEAIDQLGAGAIAGLLNVMRSLCGPDFQALEASFAHKKPLDIRPYREFFRIPLYFDAPLYSLIFSRKWLDACPPHADKDLQRILQKQLKANQSDSDESFIGHVRVLIRSTLAAGHCNEQDIAALLDMGPRTLIRRLEAFGTTYRELLDESRYELAQRMLRNTSLSVGDISDALCYSRASSFDRAFRRWSGCTPIEWQKSQNDSQ